MGTNPASERHDPLRSNGNIVARWCSVGPRARETVHGRKESTGDDADRLPEQGRRPSQYVLTDQSTGNKTPVTGTSDLEQHAMNHTVRLTGNTTTENGRAVFTATKVEHISATCATPSDKK